MTDIRPCVLGCKNAEGIPYRAAPGLHTCHPCSDRLRRTLGSIETTYATVTAIHELIPGGHGPSGVRTPPGPRSPANDTVLVHTDPRSAWNDQPAALATVESWARLIREDLSVDVPPDQMHATVPIGRVTMARELATLRFHWDWLMGQDTIVADFAADMHAVLNALRAVDAQQARALRVGRCPTVIIPAEHLGIPIDLECGAWLRLKPGQDVITCRNCAHNWPRARWSEIGQPWATYAELGRVFAMPNGTLRRWAHEDQWRTVKIGRDAMLLRADAVNSYTRRRGALPLGEAG